GHHDDAIPVPRHDVLVDACVARAGDEDPGPTGSALSPDVAPHSILEDLRAVRYLEVDPYPVIVIDVVPVNSYLATVDIAPDARAVVEIHLVIADFDVRSIGDLHTASFPIGIEAL